MKDCERQYRMWLNNGVKAHAQNIFCFFCLWLIQELNWTLWRCSSSWSTFHHLMYTQEQFGCDQLHFFSELVCFLTCFSPAHRSVVNFAEREWETFWLAYCFQNEIGHLDGAAAHCPHSTFDVRPWAVSPWQTLFHRSERHFDLLGVSRMKLDI